MNEFYSQLLHVTGHIDRISAEVLQYLAVLVAFWASHLHPFSVPTFTTNFSVKSSLQLSEGACEGLFEGLGDLVGFGDFVGIGVDLVGLLEGRFEGYSLGDLDGLPDGAGEGTWEGLFVGVLDGMVETEGELLGSWLGFGLGGFTGCLLGMGDLVGIGLVGLAVGTESAQLLHDFLQISITSESQYFAILIALFVSHEHPFSTPRLL